MGKNLFELFDKVQAGKVVQIEMDQIVPCRYQPRVQFDEEAIEELRKSIHTNGLISPITVRPIDEGYEIIAGERRYRACRMEGFKTIPCYVLTPGEDQAAQMALVENIQRENLTAVEEARAYVQILRQSGMSQEELAEQVGRSQSAVANKIRLLNLPDSVQQAVLEHRLSERHARALLTLPKEKQESVAKLVEERKLNVKDTEAYIAKVSAPVKKRRKQKTKGFTRSTQLGINSVAQCVDMLVKMGIDVVMETEDTDACVCVHVRFPKE